MTSIKKHSDFEHLRSLENKSREEEMVKKNTNGDYSSISIWNGWEIPNLPDPW